MTFKELDKLLKNNGWVLVRSKGSHFQYQHKEHPNTIAVPNHGGKDIKKRHFKQHTETGRAKVSPRLCADHIES